MPHQTAELIEDLRSRNIDHDVIMIPNEIHVMARYASWMILFNATDVYFDRHLDKRGPPIRKQVQYSGFDRRYVGPSLSQAQSKFSDPPESSTKKLNVIKHDRV